MDALKRFQDLMRDLFQFDMADLDFGLYRLLRLKRDEIEAFLQKQLPRQVDEAFAAMAEEEKASLKVKVDELAESIREKVAEDAITADGHVKYEYRESSVKFVKEIVGEYEVAREKLASTEAIEADKVDVFNHLYNFFSRYYEDGDFIPKRRYGARETYAVPYDGSEVFFHWANRDQHYVKTAETFKDYAFTVEGNLFSQGDWRVRFVLIEASVPKDNVKGDRRFFFPSPGSVQYEAKALECIIPFEYRPPTDEEIHEFRKTEKGKFPDQRNILEGRFPDVLGAISDENLRAALSTDQRTQAEIDENKPEMPLLLKRMLHYARRNTSDYFIHKNLRRFLLEEFQFYIKDQVLHIEDLEGDFEVRCRMIRVLRRLGEQVIEFLSQIEDAQKHLFEKKKFVLETSYLIPIQHIPNDCWPDIVANASQKSQWKDWFALKPQKNLFNQKGEINKAFLEQHPTLVVDTRNFENEWSRQLLESLPFDDLDDATDGLVVHSENYQALRLLLERYREQVKCIYIDPPFNSPSSEILYKNDYKHSSWLTMMASRLICSTQIMHKKTVYVLAIDENEQETAGQLLNLVFPNHEIKCITIVNNPSGQQGSNFSDCHEYAYFIYPPINRIIGLHRRDENADVRSLRDVSTGSHLRTDAANCFYPIFVRDGEIIGFGDVSEDDFHPGSANVHKEDGTMEIYPIDAQGNERKWVFARDTVETIRAELSVEFNRRRRIWDIIRTKTNFNFKTVWWDKKYSSNSYGSALLNQIIPNQPFTFPKSIYTVIDCIEAASSGSPNSLILDFFAGSGTTGHAVINLNREDCGRRKYILVEMGEYFDTVLLPRIAKVMFTPEWKEGKPKRMATLEEAERTPRLVKILRLESYEDALNNVAAPSNQERVALREKAYKDVAGEDEYRLKYLVSLPLESSETMLNLSALERPFDYTIEILTEEGPKRKPVDLIETFNYLYGLRVRKVETWINEKDRVNLKGGRQKSPREYRVVRATDREQKRRVLVIWRDMTGLDPEVERKFLEAEVKDLEAKGDIYDELLINGDTAAKGFISLDPLFKRLMMAGEEENA